jgi:predicted MFS family arabinose efflux permease
MKLPLIILALGTFAAGTAELVIAGILPLMAQDFNQPVGAMGQLVTLYALVFALGAPLLTALSARMNRRHLLAAALGLFILGNLLTITLSGYGLIFLARIIAACGSAIYSSVAVAVAASLVPAHKQGFAISMVVAGWSISSIIGAPLGTLLGQNFGWRFSFILVIILSAIAAAGIWWRLPKVTPLAVSHLKEQIALLTHPALLTALGVSGLFLAGQYTVYTYLAAFLKDTARLDGAIISLALLAYGLAGTFGTFLGGFGADRLGVNRTLIIGISLNLLAMLALPVIGVSALGAVLVTLVWGLSSWSFTSSQQCRLLKLAPQAGELVLSLNLSAFNLGIAAGAGLGGFVFSQFGAFEVAWSGASVVLAAFGLTLLSLVLATNRRPVSADLAHAADA